MSLRWLIDSDLGNIASLPLLQPFPPPRQLFAEEFGGAGAEEVIGNFVFGGHFLEGVIDDAVLGAGEDGLGGLQIVEAGPEDVGGGGVGDVVGLAFVVLRFAQAGETMGVEPLQRGLDDGDDFGRGGAAAHEELHEVRRFAAAEGWRLFGTGFDGLKRERVMLGAPDGGLAVDADLHGGDVGDAFVERGLRPLLQRVIGEGEVVVALGEVVEDL